MNDFPKDWPKDNPADLERAIMLLGAIAKGQKIKLTKYRWLKEKLRFFRINKDQAAAWKTSLKKWRVEQEREPDVIEQAYIAALEELMG